MIMNYNKYINENLKPKKSSLKSKSDEILGIIKKYKNKSDLNYNENFEIKSGDIVYLNGLSGQIAKKLNGIKCKVIRKNRDKEDCYDLYSDKLAKSKNDEANLIGMPSEFIFKNKPTIIDEPEPKKRPTAKKINKK